MIRPLVMKYVTYPFFFSSGFPSRMHIDRARITACQTNRNKQLARRGGFIHRGTHCSSALVSGYRASETLSSDDSVSRATLLTSSATNSYTSARNLRNHGSALWVSPNSSIRHEIHYRLRLLGRLRVCSRKPSSNYSRHLYFFVSDLQQNSVHTIYSHALVTRYLA